jgi:hypothetical protein
MWEAILILMAGLILATLILWFLFKFWPVTGKWGLIRGSLDEVDCPECGDSVPD